MRSTLLLVVLLLCAACEPARPRYRYYVPGPGFEEVIEVGIARPHPSQIRAGQWVELHAERRAGPWQIADSTTQDPPCERVSPVAEEFEVASKVRWEIRPAEGVGFNVPGPPDFEREVRFPRPGRYEIWARSAGCAGEVVSNRIVVEVR